MACNCASKEQIEELYRKFGEKKTPTKGETINFKVKKIIRYTGVAICCVFLTPIIFLYVFYKAFGDDDHRISVKKFFNMGKKQLGSNVG